MKSVDRVRQFLINHCVDANIMLLEQSTHTAQQAADALGVSINQIVKSLVFKTAHSDKPLLALVGGDKRLDMTKLTQLIGEKPMQADANFVKLTTGFTIGGVAPVGSLTPLPVYMDVTLLTLDAIWAAAGHPRSIFNIKPDTLAAITAAIIADIAEN